MKKKIISLLAVVMTAMTASAVDVPTYSLTKAEGAEAHGTITFKVNNQVVTSAAEGDEVTVIVTPTEGWDAYETWGEWSAAIVKAPQRRVAAKNIDILKDFDLTPVQGQTNQWTFTMQRANATISASYRKKG